MDGGGQHPSSGAAIIVSAAMLPALAESGRYIFAAAQAWTL
jgi:hypothetical protein